MSTAMRFLVISRRLDLIKNFICIAHGGTDNSYTNAFLLFLKTHCSFLSIGHRIFSTCLNFNHCTFNIVVDIESRPAQDGSCAGDLAHIHNAVVC